MIKAGNRLERIAGQLSFWKRATCYIPLRVAPLSEFFISEKCVCQFKSANAASPIILSVAALFLYF